MHVLSRSSLTFHSVLGLMLGLGAGTISTAGTELGWMPGIAVLAIYLFIAFRRPLRRRRATRHPLPREATDWLGNHIPLYNRLANTGRGRFDRDVQIVLDEWIYEGVHDVEITAEMKLGVAAGAALLLHGRPEWELPYRQTVLFYPDYFDEDYILGGKGGFDGMAHEQGPVILSAKALEESWAKSGNGSNVVLHELAHLLDFETEFADGVPSMIDPRSMDAWRAMVEHEMQRIRDRQSILRSYGATDPVEFFAVAVESFFERPKRMKKYHPELFAALIALFNLDPWTGNPPIDPVL